MPDKLTADMHTHSPRSRWRSIRDYNEGRPATRARIQVRNKRFILQELISSVALVADAAFSSK